MKLSDKILVIASWLESDNELLADTKAAEHLDRMALTFVYAAESLKDLASEIKQTEEETSLVTPESLEEMAAVATAFDASDDELLKKQASVLDEILLSLSAPRDYIFNFKKAEDAKIEQLKKKYREPKLEADENNKVSEAIDAIEVSPYYKSYRPLQAPMSTRSCIDHPGAQLMHVGDNEWQCSLDHKVYNYDTGFETLTGKKVPGGSISEQTPKDQQEAHIMFDTREQKLYGDRS